MKMRKKHNRQLVKILEERLGESGRGREIDKRYGTRNKKTINEMRK